MDAYKKVTLGVEAIRYIRDNLREGHTFAKHLFQQLDIERGNVITLLPADINADATDLNDFETGGKLPEPPSETHSYVTTADGSQVRLVPIPNTNSRVIEDIHNFLSGGPGRICLFEDALASSTDPWIDSATTRLLFFNEEVYHFLTELDADSNKIEETLKGAKSISPPLIGALTFAPPEGDFSCYRRETTSEELKRLAERTLKIIVGAYDGESYLIWMKQ